MGGSGIAGCTAHLRLEALPDGRWHGRMIHLAESGANLYEGASLAGVIKAFSDQGEGHLVVPAAQGVDFQCNQSDLSLELQNKFRQMGSAAMAGTTVWFRLVAINAYWHAKEVVLAGDGTKKVALNANKGILAADCHF
ncbi:unnamed protein product [Effrenium voratum]|nr:unnamed protein product [Effrenium voratum]